MEHKSQESLHTALEALGSSITEIVESALSVEDVALKSSKPLQFTADPDKGSYGQGLQWRGDGPTKQFTYRANPDRIWTSETVDLAEGKSFSIGNTPVLSQNELGSTVRSSELTKVGTLNNLRTQGDLVIDDYIFYNSTLDALGIGTEEPNGKFSIATLDAEFIVDTSPRAIKVGAWTTSDLELITDDTTRLTIRSNGDVIVGNDDNDTKVTVNGAIGINVKNIDSGVDLAVNKDIKFQNKRFSVGDSPPAAGTFRKGDIVWNDDPKPTGYVGWICIREGTPGEWKPFGTIGQ